MEADDLEVVAIKCINGVRSTFDRDLVRKTLATYRLAGGGIEREFLQPALDCILTDWLIWLLYIVAMCLEQDDLQQREAEAEQIDFVLATILRLERLVPELLEIADGMADS